MAQSSINVTEGSGKRLNTWDRTISSVLVQDQVVLPGLGAYPTYTVRNVASTATSASHLTQLMAGSSLNVYVTRIRVAQAAIAGAVATADIRIVRLSTAGTGGSTGIGPIGLDGSDAAAGATAQQLPSSKGTEGNQILIRPLGLVAAHPCTSSWEWTPTTLGKAIRIAAGTSNGLAVKIETGIATSTVAIEIEFIELSY